MAVNLHPLVLAVDDDPSFNLLLTKSIEPLGFNVTTVSSIEEFLHQLKVLTPNLCLVDLNIGEQGNGFALIESARAAFGPTVPILVLSAVSSQQQIAHAIELGANDFIIKPANRAFLATKLGKYVPLDKVQQIQVPMIPVPERQSGAFIQAQFSVVGVDELGVSVSSNNLISKGTDVWLSGEIISEITGGEKKIRLVAMSSFAKADGSYVSRLEFSLDHMDLLMAVRRWLIKTRG